MTNPPTVEAIQQFLIDAARPTKRTRTEDILIGAQALEYCGYLLALLSKAPEPTPSGKTTITRMAAHGASDDDAAAAATPAQGQITRDQVQDLVSDWAAALWPNTHGELLQQNALRKLRDLILHRLQGGQEVVTAAARDVLAERQRQVSSEGWTPEHDDAHDMGELALAAASYAHSGSGKNPDYKRSVEPSDIGNNDAWVPRPWPFNWAAKWWKPKDPRRDLVRAGALILAEIERLDRLTTFSITRKG